MFYEDLTKDELMLILEYEKFIQSQLDPKSFEYKLCKAKINYLSFLITK